jgi:T5orf172 domain-containing protein
MIYLIGEQPTLGPVKIGWTRNIPLQRLCALALDSDTTRIPHSVSRANLHLLASMPGDRRIERAVHAMHAGQRLTGEWFNLGWSTRIAVDRFAFAVREAQRARLVRDA